MEQSSNKKNLTNSQGFHKPRISIEEKVHQTLKNKLSHHVSIAYQSEFSQNNLVSMSRKNKSQEMQLFESIDKEDIFLIVYRFVGKLITNSEYVKNLIEELNFSKEKSENVFKGISKDSHGGSSSSCQSNKINSKQNIANTQSDNQLGLVPVISIKKPTMVEFSSDECIRISDSNKDETLVLFDRKEDLNLKKRRNNVSILLDSLGFEGSNSQFGSVCSSWFSMATTINLQDIKVPSLILTKELVAKIYQDPQPFLINLSLCLMMKYLTYSKSCINCQNSCWILSIATIIAYKIYYDEPIQGLIQSFAQILQIPENTVKDLQRYFLSKIDFLAVISNQQYQLMLSKIIST